MTHAMSVDKQLGHRLAAARTAAGLTVRQLAARLDWPFTTLANYEAGRRPIRVTQLVAIAEALGLAPATFLVDLPELATVIQRLDGDLDGCLQVAFFLQSLDADNDESTPYSRGVDDGPSMRR